MLYQIQSNSLNTQNRVPLRVINLNGGGGPSEGYTMVVACSLFPLYYRVIRFSGPPSSLIHSEIRVQIFYALHRVYRTGK